MNGEAAVIYTLGSSNRSAEEFLGLLQEGAWAARLAGEPYHRQRAILGAKGAN